MKAKTIKGKTPEEIESALQEIMTDGFKPTLAIVFLSISQDREGVCKLLDIRGLAIFGASTNANLLMMKLKKIPRRLFCWI